MEAIPTLETQRLRPLTLSDAPAVRLLAGASEEGTVAFEDVRRAIQAFRQDAALVKAIRPPRRLPS